MDSYDAVEVDYFLIVVFPFYPSQGEPVGSVGAADLRCGVVVVESTDAAESRCADPRGWMVQDSANVAADQSHCAPSRGWMVQDSADVAESHCAPSRGGVQDSAGAAESGCSLSRGVVVNLMSSALDLT